MAKTTIHYDELGACEICGNCCEKKHPWYYCANNNENFGNISNPEGCEDFIIAELDEDDEDDDNGDFNPNEPIDCPNCGNDAYWEGGYYECEQCGWCSSSDDEN